MAILTNDAVIDLSNGPGGESNTILVADLKALIASLSAVQAYEGQSIRYLEPNGPWVENQQLNITITIEGNAAI